VTPALLVLSEVYDPNCPAYVDGERVPLHRANYLFRAIPIPAGEHRVELRYEPRTLRVGVALTLLTAVGITVGLGSLSAARFFARRGASAGPSAPRPPHRGGESGVRAWRAVRL
jgi:hypothetical protein